MTDSRSPTDLRVHATARRAAALPLLGLLLSLASSGCAASGSESRGQALDLRSPLAVLIAPLAPLCEAACEQEAACYGDDDTEIAACQTACFAVFDALASDSPSVRTCVAARQAELECFSALGCDDLERYYAATPAGERPCAAEDQAAVTACDL
jgi:hypothetical protein